MNPTLRKLNTNRHMPFAILWFFLIEKIIIERNVISIARIARKAPKFLSSKAHRGASVRSEIGVRIEIARLSW